MLVTLLLRSTKVDRVANRSMNKIDLNLNPFWKSSATPLCHKLVVVGYHRVVDSESMCCEKHDDFAMRWEPCSIFLFHAVLEFVMSFIHSFLVTWFGN